MQIRTGTVLALLTHILCIAAAFPGNFLRDEVYSYGPRRYDNGRSRGSVNIDRYGISETLRDLTDLTKRSIRNVQEGTLPNAPIQLRSSTGVSKRREDNVNIGTGQTVEVLRPFAEPKNVGFHVSLTSSQHINRNDDGMVLFDTILESIPDDQRNGYYSNGVFTSPVSGTYLVTLSIASFGSGRIYVSVYVNNHIKKLTVVSEGRSGVAQGSQTGFIKLRAGDRLSVIIDRPKEVKVLGGNLSSWSVYLLNK